MGKKEKGGKLTDIFLSSKFWPKGIMRREGPKVIFFNRIDPSGLNQSNSNVLGTNIILYYCIIKGSICKTPKKIILPHL